MTLKTVPVTGTLHNADGSVAAGASVVAQLTVTDSDGGVIVPSQITTTADSGGNFTLNLWPNARGINGSQYRVKAQMTGALPGVLLTNLLITVPDSDPTIPVPIANILNRTGPSALSDAKAAMLAAQAFSLQAQQAIASAMAVGADLPNVDALAAALTGLNAVAADLANLNAVAGDLTNINVLAAAISALNSVAADLTNINTVAADKTNIDALAGAITAVNACVTNLTAIQNAATNAQAAQTAAAAALVSQNAASTSATSAAGSASAALGYSNTATLAAAASGVYPNAAASNVPRGLTQASVGAITPGSGGTNGTFALAWSSGNFSINPVGTFTVAGNVLTAVTMTIPQNAPGTGLYIGASPTVPTPSFAASAGLTGAAVALTAQFLVASGQEYLVQSADGLTLDHYKNVSGVATSDTANVQSIPTASALSPQVPVGYTFAQAGADGVVPSGVQSDGTQVTDALQLQTSLNSLPIGMVTATARAAVAAGTFHAELCHVIGYGQSLMLGQEGYYVQSDTQPYDNVMFNAGVIAVSGSGTEAANHASVVPLVNAYVTTSNSQIGESPIVNAVNTVKRLLALENNLLYTGQAYKFLASVTAIGNTSITNLSKGTTGYTNLLADIDYGMALAAASNLSYNVPAVLFAQGERDIFDGTSYASYLALLLQLYTDLNTDIKAKTGQGNDIYLILDQVSDNITGTPNTNIPLAQLQASVQNAKIILAAPTYHLPHAAVGDAHLTGPSYGRLGAHYGVALKRSVIEGGRFLPVSPISAMRQGKLATLKFNVPVRPLVLDASIFAGAANSGFSLVDNVGAAMTISSIAVVQPDTVKIVASATIPLGARVLYGFTSYGGNLRDSQGAYIDAGIKQAMPLYNPCVTFSQTLA